MDLNKLVNSVQKVVLKISIVFLPVILIGNFGAIFLSDEPGSKKLEAFGGTLFAGGVGLIILLFVRHGIRSK